MAMDCPDQLEIPQTIEGGVKAESAAGSTKERLTEKSSTTMLESRLSRLRSSGSRKAERAKKSKRTYVKHNYVDHYFDPFYDPIEQENEREEGSRRGPRGGVVEPFPGRLYNMLQDAEASEFDGVVSWQPHGRCFIVHDPKPFVKEIMPQ